MPRSAHLPIRISLRRAVACAVLAGAVFACFYHGLFLAVATATWALATLERDRRLLRGYALAAGLALLLAVPVVRAFSDSYGSAVHIAAPYASASLDELFVPSGVPGALLPLVVSIEVISFLSRPISLSIRLFANMLAGHITLKVFAGFVASLGAFGAIGVAGSILPLLMTVALTGLEFLVSFLQAYVFAVLTCMYLNDALHPGGH